MLENLIKNSLEKEPIVIPNYMLNKIYISVEGVRTLFTLDEYITGLIDLRMEKKLVEVNKNGE